MLYKDLDATMKKSFLASLRKTFITFLEDEHYVFVEEGVSFVTDAFVQRVVEDLQEKRSFQKWAQVDFEVPDDEMKDLLLQMEQSMRVKRCTLKQRSFYMNLVEDLGLEECIPSDYLYMKRRLAERQAMKAVQVEAERKVKPATEKQIETITRVWLQTFGEELELAEDVTQSEVQELFHKVNNHAGYGQWR
ncbi:hypothetical protein [Bacillus cereus]|uniref:Uncharacterized protein n=1 Tax=Bacillus cereus TaxID=1396 RepID=A0AAW5L2V7_BACCE|nr:hypothetical protein [Bacillus cereus]MCQ6288592.1 hypothetical protein [Bacillus cereus]MCQ6317914.1 hypothetical protein [Bacillus cereus]MCQ6329103.1 hypothetical protein [Bacillus cereus]MCQ6385765.1 hypothetical protein [Bacillus cereus]